jgi:hypothetical protein
MGLRSLFGAGVSGTAIMLSATRAGGVFLVVLALSGMGLVAFRLGCLSVRTSV